ncbi:ankyrin repeat-containing domain protein [Russula aff. rugulosa BPL654]|nr:ankyrin repeat-containing domain protein [Russula aff. rugulosa BPL654]
MPQPFLETSRWSDINGVQRADVNVRDRVGWTPLLWASRSPHFKDGSVLRLLLEHGADINLQNQIGWTPLHLASFNGALEVVQLLVEHGADVEAKDKKGKTALQVALGEDIMES